MRVRAKQKGFYPDSLKEPGEVFELTTDRHFSARWMEEVADGEDVAEAEPAADYDGGAGLSAVSVRPGLMRVADLRVMAEEKGLEHEGLNKAELVDLLEPKPDP